MADSINGHLVEPFHGVRFYSSDQDISALVVDFLIAGLMKGQSVAMIATPERRHHILERVSMGFDIAPLQRDGLLVVLDAAETLDGLLKNDEIDGRAFEEAVPPMLAELSRQGTTPVRLYGEMVDLLWRQHRQTSAAQLELHTRRISARLPLLTLCGYSARPFARDRRGAAHVCGFHTHVLTRHWDENLTRSVDKLFPFKRPSG